MQSEQYLMATTTNRRILLARRPTGEPGEADITSKRNLRNLRIIFSVSW
jgi:hypothetical protein